jgi:LysR family nitrogen assimilation transcriptional regulator
MIELRQLRYFVTIVDAGSLTRAAELLYVAQPALSQQLAALESNVNAKLLNRSSKGIKPTEAGLALYKHAQAVLKMVEDTKAVVRTPEAGLSGRVRLGIPATIASILVAPLVERLQEKHPGIILEVYENPSSYLAPQLLEQRVDLSLLVDSIPGNGLIASPLLSENLYFVHRKDGHPLGKPSHVTLDDIQRIPMVLPTRSTTLRQLIDNAFNAQGIEPAVVAETSSMQTLLTLVTQAPVGTFQTLAAVASHKDGKTLLVSLIQPVMVRRLYLAYSKYAALSDASVQVHAVILALAKELVNKGQWRGAVLQTNDVMIS